MNRNNRISFLTEESPPGEGTRRLRRASDLRWNLDAMRRVEPVVGSQVAAWAGRPAAAGGQVAEPTRNVPPRARPVGVAYRQMELAIRMRGFGYWKDHGEAGQRYRYRGNFVHVRTSREVSCDSTEILSVT